jgi:hypothetical protein
MNIGLHDKRIATYLLDRVGHQPMPGRDYGLVDLLQRLGP